jgi:Tfp pilus assembly protein PilX
MKIKDLIKDEQGSVMIIALLVLIILTLVGIGANRTTSTDIQIAANEKFHKVAFYNADAGVYATPKLISSAIEDGANPTGTGFTYLDAGTDTFFRELMGYDSADTTRDISFVLGGENIEVDVQRTGAQNLAGGGAEFAAGAEGVGSGSAGGFAIFYALDSLGDGPRNAVSNVGATYRKINAPGGL